MNILEILSLLVESIRVDGRRNTLVASQSRVRTIGVARAMCDLRCAGLGELAKMDVTRLHESLSVANRYHLVGIVQSDLGSVGGSTAELGHDDALVGVFHALKLLLVLPYLGIASRTTVLIEE